MAESPAVSSEPSENASRDDQLLFLIRLLLKERSDGDRIAIPDSAEGRFNLFRALVNMRAPKPVSAGFLKVQDAMLAQMTREKGIAVAADLPKTPRNDRIALWQGDITAIDADAIVNAANSDMLGCFLPGHHCIDNAIHTFAGVQLRLECARIMAAQGYAEPTGQAKVTGGYNLPARNIIHTVGPIVQGAPDRRDAELLARCYASCLQAARYVGCRTIVFCCISTGVFGYPHREAAAIAVKTAERFLAADESGIEVVFDVFAEEDRAIYEELLDSDASHSR